MQAGLNCYLKRSPMRLFFTAFQFLTIIPLPVRLNYQDGDLGRSMRWFPLVGLALGAMLAALHYCLLFIFPEQVVAVLLVAVLALVTGALHLDGLADVFDGFGARGERERFLAVMKDSGTGAIGAVALFLGLLLKYQALLHLPAGVKYGGIIIFPAVARFSQVLMTAGSRRARIDGLGAGFISSAGTREIVFAAAIVLTAAYALLDFTGLFCCLIVAIFAWLSRNYFHSRLGGITGDIIGCTSELSEILALLTIIAFADKIKDLL
jgi:adenosylcobinamide-GDP ribazoletransferase